jgi:hypothetical protein
VLALAGFPSGSVFAVPCGCEACRSAAVTFTPPAQFGAKKLEFSLRSPFDLMVDRRSYTSWLAFLNTVRTERFEQFLALRPSLLAIATAAHG